MLTSAADTLTNVSLGQLVVILIGDVRGLPPEPLALLASHGALIVPAATPGVASDWLARLSSLDGCQADGLRLGELIIDPSAHGVRWRSRPLALTEQEFQILLTLARSRGQAASFADLHRQVWRDRRTGTTDRLRCAIRRLRHKLSAAGCGCEVVSVRGWGFRLSENSRGGQGASPYRAFADRNAHPFEDVRHRCEPDVPGGAVRPAPAPAAHPAGGPWSR